MRRVLRVAILLACLPSAVAAQFCSNCILNTAAPQVAQFNVTSGTVRGILTVGSLNLLSGITTAGTITAGQFVGGGVGLTGLNASNLGSGTVPSARVAGAYSGITGLGTIASGAWQASIIGPTYGGIGADLHIAGTAGGLPYFVGAGVQGVITTPGGPRVLMTAGSGATPVWTSSPALTGQNFSAISLSALNSGTLPHSIQVDTNSIALVNGAGVLGNIPGGASFLTVALPVGNLAGGTLPTANAASSITVTGVRPGYYGGPTTVAQFHVNTDGRLDVANQFNMVFYSTAIVPGPLPPGVTIPANQITSGTLANNVIASSIAANGILAGNYGGPARTLTVTVGGDGRLSAITQPLIALPPAQINAGTLPGTVGVPPTNLQAGTIPNNVIASSVGANGAVPGTYGSPTASAQFVLTADGRIASATSLPIPGASTSTAFNNIDNAWRHSQTSQSASSWTIHGLIATDVGFVGPGGSITGLTPANLSAGTIPANVIASSVGANGITPGSCGDATHSCTITWTADGRATFQSQAAITGVPASSVAAANVTAGTLIDAVKFSTAGVYPGFNGASEFVQLAGTGFLPALNGSALTNLTATAIANGTLPTGVKITTANINPGFNAASELVQLDSSGKLPALDGSALTNVTASAIAANNVTAGTLGTSVKITTANINPGFNGASELVQLDGSAHLPALNASALTSLTPANLSAGQLPTNVTITTANVAPGLNGASELVQFDASTHYPAANGSAITSLTAANIAAGQLPTTVQVTTANITPGFNGANEIVQLNGSGNLPALNAAALTSLTAANISAGTLGPAVIASSVAATGVTAGNYGDANNIPVITVGGDGRVSSVSTVPNSGGTAAPGMTGTYITATSSIVTNGNVDLIYTNSSTGTIHISTYGANLTAFSQLWISNTSSSPLVVDSAYGNVYIFDYFGTSTKTNTTSGNLTIPAYNSLRIEWTTSNSTGIWKPDGNANFGSFCTGGSFTITATGTTNKTVPTGCNHMAFQMTAAGGSGAAVNGGFSGGGGGGGGARGTAPVTPGTVLAIALGAPGAAVPSQANGNDAADSTITNSQSVVLATAGGGKKGHTQAVDNSNGGAGGTASCDASVPNCTTGTGGAGGTGGSGNNAADGGTGGDGGAAGGAKATGTANSGGGGGGAGPLGGVGSAGRHAPGQSPPTDDGSLAGGGSGGMDNSGAPATGAGGGPKMIGTWMP